MCLLFKICIWNSWNAERVWFEVYSKFNYKHWKTFKFECEQWQLALTLRRWQLMWTLWNVKKEWTRMNYLSHHRFELHVSEKSKETETNTSYMFWTDWRPLDISSALEDIKWELHSFVTGVLEMEKMHFGVGYSGHGHHSMNR